MKIRLDQVDDPFDWQETLKLPPAELDRPELVDLGEIGCRGRISRAAEGLLLRASLQYRQSLRCMRCLETVAVSVSADLDLLIQIGGSEAAEEELALEKQDLGIIFLERPQLDTRPILIEQIQLGIPMKPLCREECGGLCSSCGADLNQGPCGCGGATDSRWGALAALKQERPDRDDPN